MKKLLFTGLLMAVLAAAPAFAGGDAPAGAAGDAGGDARGTSAQASASARLNDIDPYTTKNWAYYWGLPYTYDNGSFNNASKQIIKTNTVPGPDLAPEYTLAPAQLRAQAGW